MQANLDCPHALPQQFSDLRRSKRVGFMQENNRPVAVREKIQTALYTGTGLFTFGYLQRGRYRGRNRRDSSLSFYLVDRDLHNTPTESIDANVCADTVQPASH